MDIAIGKLLLNSSTNGCGVMESLITDGGKYEISKSIMDHLCSLFISQYESDPCHQHQNKSENDYGDSECYVYTIMNLSGCLASCWLLCLTCLCITQCHIMCCTWWHHTSPSTHWTSPRHQFPTLLLLLGTWLLQCRS